MKREFLNQTIISLQSATSELRDTLRVSNSVESIILLDLIESSVKLTRRVQELAGAIDADTTL